MNFHLHRLFRPDPQHGRTVRDSGATCAPSGRAEQDLGVGVLQVEACWARPPRPRIAASRASKQPARARGTADLRLHDRAIPRCSRGRTWWKRDGPRSSRCRKRGEPPHRRIFRTTQPAVGDRKRRKNCYGATVGTGGRRRSLPLPSLAELRQAMWGRLQPARDFSPAGEARMNAAAGGLKPRRRLKPANTPCHRILRDSVSLT